MSAVDQRVGTGASRVRRLLTRALLVVGGSLAGTAAVWALSGAPASAEVPADHDVVTGVALGGPQGPLPGRYPRGAVEAALTGVRATPVGHAVRDLDTTLRAPRVRESSPPDLGRVADDIRGAVEHVGGWLRPRLSEPASVDVVGGAAAQRPTETTPTATAAPVPAGTPVVQGVFATLAGWWPVLSRQPVLALPGDRGPSLPGDPSGLPSMPFAPLGVPVHCSCGGDGSGASGGGSGPFAAASTDHLDSAVARALFPATERKAVTPGKQPGVTPD